MNLFKEMTVLYINKWNAQSLSTFAISVMMLFSPLTASACGEDGSCSTGSITAEQGDAILKELQQIRLLLQQERGGGDQQAVRMAPLELKGPVELSLDVGNRMGSKDAKLALVEFTDYQCPYCKRFFDSTFSALKKQYVDSGKLLYIGRNLPLPFHDHAKQAAIATECAGDQGHYWQMHDVLFAKSPELDDATLKAAAAAMQLNTEAFEACLSGGKYDKAIEADIQAASSIGIDGTPSFLLGEIKDGKVVGQLIVGAQPLAAFAQKIDALLK